MADAQQPERFLPLPVVESRTAYKRSRIYQLAAEGKFPKPFRIGDNKSVWAESAINAWMASKMEAA